MTKRGVCLPLLRCSRPLSNCPSQLPKRLVCSSCCSCRVVQNCLCPPGGVVVVALYRCVVGKPGNNFVNCGYGLAEDPLTTAPYSWPTPTSGSSPDPLGWFPCSVGSSCAGICAQQTLWRACFLVTGGRQGKERERRSGNDGEPEPGHMTG